MFNISLEDHQFLSIQKDVLESGLMRLLQWVISKGNPSVSPGALRDLGPPPQPMLHWIPPKFHHTRTHPHVCALLTAKEQEGIWDWKARLRGIVSYFHGAGTP